MGHAFLWVISESFFFFFDLHYRFHLLHEYSAVNSYFLPTIILLFNVVEFVSLSRVLHCRFYQLKANLTRKCTINGFVLYTLYKHEKGNPVLFRFQANDIKGKKHIF